MVRHPAIFVLFAILSSAEESCYGRCNLLKLHAPCQCSESCKLSGSCCKDYTAVCAPAKTRETVEVSIGNISLTTGTSCPGFGPAWVSFETPKYQRELVLYLPKGGQEVPLWFVMHGTNQHADSFLSWTGLDKFAEEKGIAVAALQGLRTEAYGNLIRFNVGVSSEPISIDHAPDDVDFVRSVLNAVLQLPCIDKDRVHCTGYSNGGRFCSRLGSEMSEDFASIAPVSGLRYPFNNNATRPIPILGFHGSEDPINPFWGNGGSYWHISIPEAIQLWAKHNRCYWSHYQPMFMDIAGEDYSMSVYDECDAEATAKVVQLHGAGHQWPGCEHGIPGLGAVSAVDGNEMIYSFFYAKRLHSTRHEDYHI